MIIKHGTWYSDFYRSDGKRIRASLGMPSTAPRRDAERAEALMVAREEQGLTVAPVRPGGGSPVTLKEVYRRVKVDREEWRTSRSPGTLDATLEAVLLHFGRDVLCSDLTTEKVKLYRHKLLAEGRSGSTVNSRLSLIKVCLDWAVAEGLVAEESAPIIKRVKITKGRTRHYSVEECALLLAACRTISPLLGDACEFALETGLRRTEVTLAQRRDVVTAITGTTRLMVWDAKANNPSPVPLTARAIELVNLRLAEPGDMLFPITADALTKGFKAAVVACKLDADPQAVFHALRHTCATRILEIMGDLVAAQGYLRHKSLTTTQGYAHLIGKRLDAVAEALNGARSGAQNAAVVNSVPSGKTIGAR